MDCFINDCIEKLPTFDSAAKGDCVLQQLIVVRREIDRLAMICDAIKKNNEDVTQERDKWKKKYKELKESSGKTSKRKTTTTSESLNVESPKKTRSDESLNNTGSPKLFKVQMKRRPSFGKENSPTKKTPTRKMAMQLSFSRLGEDFKNLPRTSSPKNLKQPKISFEKQKDKKALETETEATFCEVLEKKTAWMSKTKDEKSVVEKKKKTSPLQKAKTENPGLFAFHPPPVKVNATVTEVSNDNKKPETTTDEIPIISQLLPPEKIKEEKFSESDLDIFDESSRGSSVVCIEVPVEQPIEVPDNTVSSEKSLIASLERGFLQQTEYNTEPPKAPEKSRNRKVFYGECSDCRDFYDKFADVNGASQADMYLRNCQNNCKASNYRKSEAQPKPPRLPLPPPPPDTPSGFWDMNTHHDDPDKTQDGL